MKALKDLPATERWPFALTVAMVWLVATYSWYLMYVRAHGASPDNEINKGLGVILIYTSPVVLGLMAAVAMRWNKLTPLTRLTAIVPIAAVGAFVFI